MISRDAIDQFLSGPGNTVDQVDGKKYGYDGSNHDDDQKIYRGISEYIAVLLFKYSDIEYAYDFLIDVPDGTVGR